MEIKVDHASQVEAVIKFNRSLSCHEIIELVRGAVAKCNRILNEERKNMSLFKRIFKTCDVYRFSYDTCRYFSYDGKAPMRRGGSYTLDPKLYPEARYEMRYLMCIIGLRSVHLYFNVIPGIAEKNQFGTRMSENDTAQCITIKANMKSSLKWKKEQAKFLELLVSIIERKI